MEILQRHSLKAHNTFSIAATAEWFIEIDSLDDLKQLAADEYFATLPFVTIGEGSNLLFTADYTGAILHPRLGVGDSIVPLPTDTEGDVLVRIGCGVIWDHFVSKALSQGLYGAENLSWIPGTVGAAAVQNIGAYGSEVSQLITKVETFDIATGKHHSFSVTDCQFAYRYSRFKRADMASHIVTYVTLRLSTCPRINLSYKALAERVAPTATPHEIREAVIAIRKEKLPDPKELPNAGSFFMNPVVPAAQFEQLAQAYPSMPFYPTDNPGKIKLSAAWLIDQSGLKGYTSGAVGTYHRQPLILVNHGGATGAEIAAFSLEVAGKVQAKFGVMLHPEVRFLS